jgi:hypothetical protein
VNLTASQQAVVDVLKTNGPLTDVGLAYFVHHRAGAYSSSRVRTARCELEAAGVVVREPSADERSHSGRTIRGWRLA